MMVQVFTAEDVFRIGIEIEKNGRAFYTAAASGTAGATIRKLLTELSAWENQHIEVFDQLRKNLPERAMNVNLFDPDDEIGLYVKAMADAAVFTKESGAEALATRCSTPAEILNLALAFEKDSVVLYSSLREAVGADFGRTEVEKLIHEELKHVGLLTRELKKLKGEG
jgi:rubrerythrin